MALNYFRLRLIAAYFGIFSFLSLPTMVALGDYQVIEKVLVNIGFLCMSSAYIFYYIHRKKSEYLLVLKYKGMEKRNRMHHLFKKYMLTPKEVEIATLILNGYKYKVIADKLFITEKTVSKHASNIFKKIGVTNKSDFRINLANTYKNTLHHV